MKHTSKIGLAAVLMLVLFAGAAFYYDQQQLAEKTALTTTHHAALEKFHSPRLGNANAKVTIVEFMDPSCEACRSFHGLIQETLEKYPGKVQLVMRYATFHHGSDKAVEILEAARKVGNFEKVLELMYGTQQGWASHHNPQPELIWQYLERFEFDVPALRQHIDPQATATLLAIDLADAKTLKVNKTPTFFVNGKPLPSFGYVQFQQLVAAEVSAAYP
ncbi:MAG: thioredoxin domain-containing protein [Mariprofundaceae bacterium]|nr:thioredoxin domain-containing protein [Mariprofundaceae bacterium]